MIGALSKEEVDRLNRLLKDYYLEEQKYELVKEFNHSP